MNPVFTVSDYSLAYGKKEVLHHVSLTIAEHAVTAFIGPSGCGKSSLLRAFNRLNDLIVDAHESGTILYEGKKIQDYNPLTLRSEVGMLFQAPSPFPMSIYDNVAYGPRCAGMRRGKELDELIVTSLQEAALYDEVKDRLKKSGLALSGGQQQRLCLARALAMKPKVLLMDEPTSSLDPLATEKIEELVLSLKEKYTIMIVTHNMEQAARISDFTAFLYLGDLAEFDTTEKLFKEPSNPKTEAYLAGRFG
jgi:phosphate transport system ATP-binding protein